MKILVVRFSSIVDVVLTTPIVRCLKQQIPNVTIHFIAKKIFVSLINQNPNIDKVIAIQSSINEVISDLKKEKYDWVIDLHKNVRTLSLKQKLKVPNPNKLDILLSKMNPRNKNQYIEVWETQNHEYIKI